MKGSDCDIVQHPRWRRMTDWPSAARNSAERRRCGLNSRGQNGTAHQSKQALRRQQHALGWREGAGFHTHGRSPSCADDDTSRNPLEALGGAFDRGLVDWVGSWSDATVGGCALARTGHSSRGVDRPHWSGRFGWLGGLRAGWLRRGAVVDAFYCRRRKLAARADQSKPRSSRARGQHCGQGTDGRNRRHRTARPRRERPRFRPRSLALGLVHEGHDRDTGCIAGRGGASFVGDDARRCVSRRDRRATCVAASDGPTATPPPFGLAGRSASTGRALEPAAFRIATKTAATRRSRDLGSGTRICPRYHDELRERGVLDRRLDARDANGCLLGGPHEASAV